MIEKSKGSEKKKKPRPEATVFGPVFEVKVINLETWNHIVHGRRKGALFIIGDLKPPIIDHKAIINTQAIKV